MDHTSPRCLTVARLCLVLILLAGGLRAASLDEELAIPTSYTTEPEEAARRIDMIRPLAEAQPARQLEVEAYLIPLERIVANSLDDRLPGEDVPPTITTPPRPLLVVRLSASKARLLEVETVEKNGPMLIATGEDGTRTVLQPQFVLAELPWRPDVELQSGGVDLEAMAKEYDAAARRIPSARAELAQEAARIRSLQHPERDAPAPDVDALVSRAYDPDADYPVAELAQLLLDAEAARTASPGRTSQIDEWAAPFREHFEQRLAGRQRHEGEWLSPVEIQARERDAARADFVGNLRLEMDATALPAGFVRMLAWSLAIAFGLPVAGGAAILVFRKSGMRAPAIALIALPPLAAFALILALTAKPTGIPSPDRATNTDSLANALFSAAQDEKPTGSDPLLTNQDALNALVARRLTPLSDEHSSPWTARRDGLAFQLAPNSLVIDESLRCLRRQFIVRYDVGISGDALSLRSVRIGALPCPGFLADRLWASLRPQLTAALEKSEVLAAYRLQISDGGNVTLTPRATAD